ncbi:MAG: asparagine synthase (glutamine-hydrolyzing) [Gloeomargarita sp. SKYG116]|nr:asparagine synthase (glutamine-hydrolyzing) [Gloeomargarita sp. SKYG116]MDW8401662.1 asparagine synthase (glutamine-hydrolyzing) [Gloeomargarita sp. SKYGB_i_bin116]
MCGIAGLWLHKQAATLALAVRQMTATLAHRGPDGEGVWVDETAQLGLGHRRLAILDLSPQGAQPMRSAAGNVLVFNGEIYNYRELRRELTAQGNRFQSQTDTEVLLAGLERWGIETCLQKCRGMFAFAFWHAQERCLYLARDRMGEKPLYYGWTATGFVFASELKAVRCSPGWRGELHRPALDVFLRYGYIPSPYSIYQGIYKLPPGTWLRLENPHHRPEPQPYWSLVDVVAPSQEPWRLSPAATVQVLDELLTQVVGEQMVADVPLGAFLSGGIDSSLIVALMQKQSPQPVKTFTIGFTEAAYNEAPWAKRVAQHLGTDHTELITTPALAMAVIPKLPQIYDEPFADNSQIPTFLVAELTRQSVTVSLSGDGGDELFGGYRQYVYARRIWRSLGWLPPKIRQSLAQALQRLPVERLNHRLRTPYYSLADNVARLVAALGESHPTKLYRHLMARWLASPLIPTTEPLPTTVFEQLAEQFPASWGVIPLLMLTDALMELPDDILVKVDRATMAVGLESRAPYLDPQVVALAGRLPLPYKVRRNQTKWILRQVLYRYVPPRLLERPKQGFVLPLGEWLRTPPLRDWAEELLRPQRLHQQGYWDVSAIQQKWQEHLAGVANWQALLWPVLMVQAWLTSPAHQS